MLPWGGASRDEAAATCAAAGFRLCTTAEWLAACEGDEGRNYPYGPDYVDDRCNGGDVRLGQSRPSGEFEQCVSPEGIADLSGNVWEWVSDGEAHGPAPGLHVRGGAYTSGLNSLRCRGAWAGVGPASRSTVIGFRCCKDAP